MASRYPTSNINPVLAEERARATFSPELITHLLDGGEGLTKTRRDLEALVLADKFFQQEPNYSFLSRGERYELALKKEGHFRAEAKRLGLNNRADNYFYGNLVYPNEASPTTLHGSMFTNVIESQGTAEQKKRWLQGPHAEDIIGTYAQTELGHGSYLRGLETTATYDERTEEFVINSPTLTATKWWPGGLGKTSNAAIIMALLYTKGTCHGIHPFFVQLRDYKTHKSMPGIKLGDIGPKVGFDMVDNGFLRFDNYRISRENLLMKNHQVHRDGRYEKTSLNEKASYGAMIFIRAMVVLDQGARLLAQAVTIAVRYSCVRHQSEYRPGEPEPKVLEYQTQQYKLFPLLAAAYAYYFAGLKMRETYFLLNYDIQQGNVTALPELHATSSGLKAISTSTAMYGIEQCRLACGGHGYSLASGIPKIYVQATAACTYEGENTVLYLQTARYLVKTYQQSSGQKVAGSVTYLTDTLEAKSSIKLPLTQSSLIDAFKYRAKRLIGRAVERMQRLQTEQRMDHHDAWNYTSADLCKAAEAHCLVYVCEAFTERASFSSDQQVSRVLEQLFQLFAVHNILNSANDFTQDGYMSGAQVDLLHDHMLSLLTQLRQNAVPLVDAFDFTDRLLGSVLGRYDGQVYENLYDWAQNSPLNKTDVHEAIKYLKSTQSKL